MDRHYFHGHFELRSLLKQFCEMMLKDRPFPTSTPQKKYQPPSFTRPSFPLSFSTKRLEFPEALHAFTFPPPPPQPPKTMSPLLVFLGLLGTGMLVVSMPIDQSSLVLARDDYIPGKKYTSISRKPTVSEPTADYSGENRSKHYRDATVLGLKQLTSETNKKRTWRYASSPNLFATLNTARSKGFMFSVITKLGILQRSQDFRRAKETVERKSYETWEATHKALLIYLQLWWASAQHLDCAWQINNFVHIVLVIYRPRTNQSQMWWRFLSLGVGGGHCVYVNIRTLPDKWSNGLHFSIAFASSFVFPEPKENRQTRTERERCNVGKMKLAERGREKDLYPPSISSFSSSGPFKNSGLLVNKLVSRCLIICQRYSSANMKHRCWDVSHHVLLSFECMKLLM